VYPDPDLHTIGSIYTDVLPSSPFYYLLQALERITL
jgi:hypothetical protein